MNIAVDVDGVVHAFSAKSKNVEARIGATVTHHGMLLLSAVKAHAAGRPGPRMITGDYNRSIALDVVRGADGSHTARIGTSKVQGARLEFGFFGVDSRGRNYHQSAYPHFGPAFDQIAPQFVDAVVRLAGED